MWSIAIAAMLHVLIYRDYFYQFPYFWYDLTTSFMSMHCFLFPFVNNHVHPVVVI